MAKLRFPVLRMPGLWPGESVPLVTLTAPVVPVPLRVPPLTVTALLASEPSTWRVPALTVVAPVNAVLALVKMSRSGS